MSHPAPTVTMLAVRLRAAGCVYAEHEARLLLAAARNAAELGELVNRRVAGEPLEYVIGWAEFCDRRIVVRPGVFVPRRRTEFLVRQALLVRQAVDAPPSARRRQRSAAAEGRRSPSSAPPPPVIVDLCCGTGAVGVVLAEALRGAQLHAVDIDPVAVRCARANVLDRGMVHRGDLCEPLPAGLRGRVDLLVANAPYVPTAAIPLLPSEAREHEPRVALDGGDDGLAVVRRILDEAPAWLAPRGRLLIETSEPQASEIVAQASLSGLTARLARSAESGAVVLIASRSVVPGPLGDQ